GGSGGDWVAQTRQVGGRTGELLPRCGGVALLQQQVTKNEPSQRCGALVPGCELGTERAIEQGARLGEVVPFEQQHSPALLRLGFACPVARAAVQQLRIGIEPLRFWTSVELGCQIRTRQRDSRLNARRNANRIRQM